MHKHTPYLKLGRFRVQLTFQDTNTAWTGESMPKQPLVRFPRVFSGEFQVGRLVTKSRGLCWLRWSLTVSVCDTANLSDVVYYGETKEQRVPA